MRYTLCLILFFNSLLTFSAPSKGLKTELDTLISQMFPQANVGVFVQDAKTKEILYEHNANKLLSPASNIKLLTAGAVLYQFGPDEHYLTTLSEYNHNFYITFSGSPDFKKEDLEHFIRFLKERGLKTIQGNIVLDTLQFKPPYYPPGVSYDDLGWYYDAPSTALILNGNAVAYDFMTAKELGQPIVIKPKNAHKVLTLINQVRTVSKEEDKEHCDLNIEIKPHNTLKLYGCLAQAEEPRTMRLAVPDPVLYAKQVIQQALKENQLSLKGAIVEGMTPKEAIVLATHQSDDFITLIARMLKESDNLYADSFTKRLGLALTGEGNFKQGAFAIKKLLAEHTSMDMKQVELGDGAGTRYNLTTPKQLAIFLSNIYDDEHLKSPFLNALPAMGVSGTLKDRMEESPLKNKIFAKTGTMHDISSLSGYLVLADDKVILFSIINNGILQGQLPKAKQLEEKILTVIMSSQV
jgi:D-alanyl-D-alanine carboxypeptidase/D-alanyl-D-alanine-endopeptidase (penicillin-binding protein 4)